MAALFQELQPSARTSGIAGALTGAIVGATGACCCPFYCVGSVSQAACGFSGNGCCRDRLILAGGPKLALRACLLLGIGAYGVDTGIDAWRDWRERERARILSERDAGPAPPAPPHLASRGGSGQPLYIPAKGPVEEEAPEDWWSHTPGWFPVRRVHFKQEEAKLLAQIQRLDELLELSKPPRPPQSDTINA